MGSYTDSIHPGRLGRRLHHLLVAACRSGGKVPNIDVFVLLQLFQARDDSLLDELLALR